MIVGPRHVHHRVGTARQGQPLHRRHLRFVAVARRSNHRSVEYIHVILLATASIHHSIGIALRMHRHLVTVPLRILATRSNDGERIAHGGIPRRRRRKGGIDHRVLGTHPRRRGRLGYRETLHGRNAELLPRGCFGRFLGRFRDPDADGSVGMKGGHPRHMFITGRRCQGGQCGNGGNTSVPSLLLVLPVLGVFVPPFVIVADSHEGIRRFREETSNGGFARLLSGGGASHASSSDNASDAVLSVHGIGNGIGDETMDVGPHSGGGRPSSSEIDAIEMRI
mmetsp:Transcript_8815/g.18995  ORF Transcript_8815/g.18995 Transcript_8815/m.18995 type:complete len:280 (+) Transcript_8815:565-1404(+)